LAANASPPHISVALGEVPGIMRSAALSILIGLVTTLVSLGAVAAFVASDLGTADLCPHAADDIAASVGTACGGGLRSRLPDCAIRHADAAGLAVAHRARPPPDLLIVNDPMALSMMAGLIVKEIPFLFLVTLAALPQTRHVETMRLGRSLGYGRIASFTILLWPPLYRQIRLAVFAVVAYASSVVDVALILGPHLPPTLPVRLIDWMNDPDLETRFLASAGAVLQLGVTLTALVAWIGLERIGALLVCSSRQAGRRWQQDMVLRTTARSVMMSPRPSSCSAGLRCWPCGRSPVFGSFPMRCLPISAFDHGCRRCRE
jgi:putative thiamine transport system permease protein